MLRRWGPFALGMIALATTAWWVSNCSLFDLRDLKVSGIHQLSVEQVERIAGLNLSTNVVWFSGEDVERRLEASPWVLDARVSRTLPSAVTIRIAERRAVAVASGMLVAADGRLLGKASSAPGLPMLRGPLAPTGRGSLPASSPQLVVARAIPPDMLRSVESVTIDARGSMTVVLRDGTLVLFGPPADAVTKWDVLSGVLDWAERKDVRPRYVDVRVPASPALRPRAQAIAGRPAGT